MGWWQKLLGRDRPEPIAPAAEADTEPIDETDVVTYVGVGPPDSILAESNEITGVLDDDGNVKEPT